MKRTIALSLLVVAIAGCHKAETAVFKPKNIDPEIAQIRASVPRPGRNNNSGHTICQANCELSLKLLKQLVKENPNQNAAFSPIGLIQDFAMLYDCSKGSVHDAVGKLLGAKGLGPNDLAYYHSQMIDDFDKDPYATIRIANGLWLSEEFTADAKQSKRMEALFGCSVNPLASDRAKAKIDLDQWVSNNTDGMIKEIMSQLDDTTALFLNALVFNGKWSQPFEESDTEPRDFHGFDGTKQVPTLWSSKMERRAGVVDSYTGLELLFRASGFSMLFVVPADKRAFDGLPSLLTADWLLDFQTQLGHGESEISLPKLELSSKLDLIPTLKSIGAGPVFAMGLDLSPLVPKNLPLPSNTFISSVFQQVKLELNETGVKATAVTETDATATEAKTDEPMNVHVDRPFYYFVMYQGTIVLCGVVVDPTKE